MLMRTKKKIVLFIQNNDTMERNEIFDKLTVIFREVMANDDIVLEEETTAEEASQEEAPEENAAAAAENASPEEPLREETADGEQHE